MLAAEDPGEVPSFAARWAGALGDDFGGHDQILDFDLLQDASAAAELEAVASALQAGPAALQQSREEELAALLAIYGEDAEYSEESGLLRVRLDPLAQRERLPDGGAWLSIALAEYPALPPVFEIESADRLSTKHADALYEELLQLALGAAGRPVLCELLQAASEFVGRRVEEKLQRESAFAERARQWAAPKPQPPRPLSVTEAELALTVEEAPAAPAAAAPAPRISALDAAAAEAGLAWDAEGEGGEEAMEWEDMSSAAFVGPLHALLARLPAHVVCVRVENVLRPDLASRFRRLWARMREHYGHAQSPAFPTAPSPNGRLRFSEPCTTFHGTRYRTLPSIVRNGLLPPGTIESRFSVGVFGKGIYSSPLASVALGYSEAQNAWEASGATHSAHSYGQRLIVCSTLMGRPCLLTSTAYDQPVAAGFDSHISPGGREFVVFSAAQILPVLVLTILDRNSLAAAPAALLPGSALRAQLRQQAEEEEREEGPAAAARRAARLEARARKHLPYGFGPYGAGKLEVLEVADSDSDEEDACELQEERWGERTLRAPPPPPRSLFPPKSGKPRHRQGK
eukprot:tig00021126_g18468.t1